MIIRFMRILDGFILINNVLFQVVAVAARNIEDAKTFAAKHNIEKAYGGYQELANDPNVDVIFSRKSDSTTANVCLSVRSSVTKPPNSIKSIIQHHHLHQHHTQHYHTTSHSQSVISQSVVS